MGSFGLGLVLNFTDNATTGINNATRAFQQMSVTADTVASSVDTSITSIVTASYALDSVGNAIRDTGISVLNVYANMSRSVIDAGMEMQGYRMQLSALYGSIDAGEAKMQEIKDYAMSSVFDIQSLIPAVTSMKAVGIEAMNEITTSSGQNTQKLLDYASDLAAMMPNMRNVYGTGVQAAMGAFKEYIAEGNALSLKRGAGLDITQILGEDKGSTIEARTQQVADLIEKLNIVGYTANLAGTPTQRLSNMQDALFNSLTKIADSGVFEVYCDLLERVSNWVFSLVENEETFNVITGVLADTISTILSPLSKMLDFIIDNSNKIIEWIKVHPELTKNILLTVAAIGALLVVGGTFLKFVSAIGMASAGFNFLKTLPTVLSTVGTAFKGVLLKATPFLALAGLLYYAWKENIFGIRDSVTQALSDLGEIFSIVSDAWTDNTLSEDKFQRAKELGILPLIEGLLQLKYYWGFLVEGFKTGFKSFFEGLAEGLSQLGILDVDVKELVASFGEFLKSLTEVGAEDKWRNIGEALGKIAGSLVVIAVAVNTLSAVATTISKVFGIFGAIGKVLGFIWSLVKIIFNPIIKVAPIVIGFFKDLGAAISLVGEGNSIFAVLGAWFPKIAGAVSKVIGVVKFLGGIFLKIFGVIKTVVVAIAGALNLPVAAVVAIIAAVTALGVIIAKNWDKVKEILGKIGSWIFNNVIIPIRNFFATMINFIVGLAANAWSWISGILSTVGTWIYNNVISPVVGFFKSLWEDITGLWSQFSTWVSTNIIDPVIMFFKRLWNKVAEIFTSLYNKICNVLGVIGGWVNENVIQPVIGFFSGLWDGITEIFNGIYDTITGVFQDAWDFVTGLWSGITNFFGGIFDGIVGWFNDTVATGEEITGIQSTVVPGAARGVHNFVGGLIQVNEEGGELITLPSGSTVIPHDDSIKESLERGINMGANSLAMYAKQHIAPAQSQPVQNDYSVTFSAGSIVIQLANATEAELEKAAEKLMKIIERKQQLKAMAVRA